MRKLTLVIFWLSIGAGCHKDVDPDCIAKSNTCLCTMELNPVCGCNGETYYNPCAAQCASVRYTKGECGK